MYQIVRDPDAQTFLNATSELLHRHEAEYSLMLGITQMLTNATANGAATETRIFAPVFLRCVLDGTTTVAAILQSRAENCIMTEANGESIAAFAEYYRQNDLVVNGVVGPNESAHLLAIELGASSNRQSKIGMAQNILQLDLVTLPPKTEGQLRVCTFADREKLECWLTEFSVEALPHDLGNAERFRKLAQLKIASREAYVWEVDHEPVSMTLVGRPTQNGISISGVYTPKNLRVKGYASNLVAGVSERMLQSGKKFCVLYTDAANPTSNKIYQDVGYRIVAESSHWILD